MPNIIDGLSMNIEQTNMDKLLLICLADNVQTKDIETMTEYALAKNIIVRDSFKDDKLW